MHDNLKTYKYKHLRAHSFVLGESSEVVTAKIIQAKLEGAPDDALYKGPDGEWRTYSEAPRSIKANIDWALETHGDKL